MQTDILNVPKAAKLKGGMARMVLRLRAMSMHLWRVIGTSGSRSDHIPGSREPIANLIAKADLSALARIATPDQALAVKAPLIATSISQIAPGRSLFVDRRVVGAKRACVAAPTARTEGPKLGTPKKSGLEQMASTL